MEIEDKPIRFGCCFCDDKKQSMKYPEVVIYLTNPEQNFFSHKECFIGKLKSEWKNEVQDE